MAEGEIIQTTASEQKPKLDKKVLLRFLVGIAAYFCLMFLINTVIFRFTTGRAADYISILMSNILFFCLVLIIKAEMSLTWSDMGLNQVNIAAGLIDVFKIWFLTWFISLLYIFLLFDSGITVPGNERLSKLLQNPSLVILFFNILLIAVIAPIVEETLFRGVLLGSLKTYCGPWTAIIVSAAIFSALHLELLGFVPRFVLGIGLGYLYIKHNSIFPSVAFHGFNNLLAVIVVTAAT